MAKLKYRLWYLLTYMLGFSEGLIGTFFPIIFLEKGGTPFQLGFYVGVISLIGSIQMIWGILLDRKPKPKRLALTALGTNSLAAVTMALPGSAGIYGSARTLNGLGNSMYGNADYYLRTAYFPTSRRGRIGSNFMGINLLGVGTAIILVGLIYDRYGFNYSWLIHSIAACIFILSVGAYLIGIPEYETKYVRNEMLISQEMIDRAISKYNIRDMLRLAQKSKGLLGYVGSLFVFNFGVAMISPYFIVSLQQSWGFSSSQLSVLMSFNTFIQVVAIFALIPIIDIFSRKKIITIGMILAVIPSMGLSFNPEFIDTIFPSRTVFWLLIFFISSIGWGIVNSTLLTLLIDYADPKIRGVAIATYGSIISLLSFFAALLAGFLIQFVLVHETHLFIISTIIRALGVILLLVVPAPPIPFADFYDQQQMFMTRLRAGFERALVYIPLSRKLRIKD